MGPLGFLPRVSHRNVRFSNQSFRVKRFQRYPRPRSLAYENLGGGRGTAN